MKSWALNSLSTQLFIHYFGGHWDKSLPLYEFSYNNSYHFGIDMASFDALYGRVVDRPYDGLRLNM
uniref:Polyprotein n=1 Tax=Solanum tuberosum TaxID=4113 RepID=M1AKV6_SOLTU